MDKQQVKSISVKEGKIFVSSLEQPIRPTRGAFELAGDYGYACEKFEAFESSLIKVSNPQPLWDLKDADDLYYVFDESGFYAPPVPLEMEVREECIHKNLIRCQVCTDGGGCTMIKKAIISFSSEVKKEEVHLMADDEHDRNILEAMKPTEDRTAEDWFNPDNAERAAYDFTAPFCFSGWLNDEIPSDEIINKTANLIRQVSKTANNDSVQKCIDTAKQKSFNIEDQAGNHLITVELTEFISELEKLKS